MIVTYLKHYVQSHTNPTSFSRIFARLIRHTEFGLSKRELAHFFVAHPEAVETSVLLAKDIAISNAIPINSACIQHVALRNWGVSEFSPKLTKWPHRRPKNDYS